MGIVSFNGIPSTDIGLEVETFPEYQIPERVYQTISVPGRNGDLVIDTGTYRNVTRSYKVSMATWNKVLYYQKMNQVAEWLHSSAGYARLEDTYEEEFFRMAYYKEALTIENLFDEAGRATISFICKPQRYYKSGEDPRLFTANGKIQNGTNFTSLPILNIVTNNTYGTVTIGEYEFAINASSGTNITVDCELQDAFYGTTNKNSFIILNGGEFPKLKPGDNVVAFTGGVQSVEVIPRWWTI